MNTATTNPQKTKYVVNLIFLCLITIVVCFAYHNSLNGVFVFDDVHNIIDNDFIKITSLAPSEIGKVFSPLQPCNNRYIANLTFALNYLNNGLDPKGFHLVNIFVHLLNAYLIYFLCQWYQFRIALSEYWNHMLLACLTAMLWAVNPIQTNAVTYIVQRMTSMSTMFCLVSLFCYLIARSSPTRKVNSSPVFKRQAVLYVISLLTWVLALLCKEIAVILPLLIIAHEVYYFDYLKRRPIKLFVMVSIGLAAVFLTTINFQGSDYFYRLVTTAFDNRDFTLVDRLLTEPRAVFFYISLFLYPLPSRLTLYHDFTISQGLFSPLTTMLAIAGTVYWLVMIYKMKNSNRLLSFGLCWVFLTLLVESTIIPLEILFEHRFYMPSIGFVLALVAACVWGFKRLGIRPVILYGFFSLLIVVQIFATAVRNTKWQDELVFALDTVEKAPESARAIINLSVAYSNKGEYDVAEMLLYEMLNNKKIDQYSTITALVNLYNLSIRHNPIVKQKIFTMIQNELAGGIKNAISSGPLYMTAQSLFKQKRYRESLLFLQLIQKHFTQLQYDFFNNLSRCQMHLGKFTEAASSLTLALVKDPDNPVVIYNLALCLKKAGKTEESGIMFQELKLNKKAGKEILQAVQKQLE